MSDTRTRPTTPPAHRLTVARILHSEWIRLITTRSTWMTLLVTGAVMAAIGLVAASVASGGSTEVAGPGPGFGASDPMATLMAGATPAFLLMAVLGVITGAREYGTGLARTTYAAVPRRWPVIGARMLALAAASSVVIAIGAATAFVGGNAVLSAADAQTVSFDDDGVVRALVGNVGYLVGTGLIGVAVGTLTRSIGSGLGFVLGIGLVLPAFGGLLLPDDWQGALDYLPSQAATAFTSLDAGSEHLSVAAGTAVFAAWVVALALAAVLMVRRRDV